MNEFITAEDIRAFTDLCAEAYRQLWLVPDEMDVDVKIGMYPSGAVQLNLKMVTMGIRLQESVAELERRIGDNK